MPGELRNGHSRQRLERVEEAKEAREEEDLVLLREPTPRVVSEDEAKPRSVEDHQHLELRWGWYEPDDD